MNAEKHKIRGILSPSGHPNSSVWGVTSIFWILWNGPFLSCFVIWHLRHSQNTKCVESASVKFPH